MSTPEGPTVPTPGGAPEPARQPRFVRPRRRRLIGGVCSGLGAHFGVDPLLLRIAFVGLTFFAGAGLWLYLAILLLTPEEGSRRAPIRLLGSSWQTVLGTIVLIVALGVLVGVLSRTLFGSAARFGAAAGFVALVGALAAIVWMRLRGRRRRSADLALARNLALVVASVAGLVLLVVAGAGLAGTEPHIAAWAVLALGVALMVSALTRVRWLVLAVGAFVLPVVVFAVAGVDLHGGLGQRFYSPHAPSELRREYQLGAGKLELDLRGVRFPQGQTRLHVRLGVGELVVVVPSNICVLTHAHLGGGYVGALGGESRGLDIDWHDSPRPPAGARVLELEGHVGLGALFVVDRPLQGRYEPAAYGNDEACLNTYAALR
jgi:phage shock protein PspC (stress-responsive transcriptional regulator)